MGSWPERLPAEVQGGRRGPLGRSAGRGSRSLDVHAAGWREGREGREGKEDGYVGEWVYVDRCRQRLSLSDEGSSELSNELARGVARGNERIRAPLPRPAL